MNVKQLLSDEDAVSPVIGVILMVAITVILAAVIGTFVLGLGDQVQSSAPNANFQFEYENINSGNEDQAVLITHNGGQDVERSTVSVQVGGETLYANGAIVDVVTGDADDELVTSPTETWEDPIATGDTQRVQENTDGDYIDSGETVRVIWESSSGGSSNTIGESTVPN